MSQQEYISREAVCAALGCENATKYGNKTPEQRDRSYSTLMLYEIADAIDDVSAADVVPVVRCRDCIHRINMEHSINNKEICCGRMAMRVMSLDDYCSHGEREAWNAANPKEGNTDE